MTFFIHKCFVHNSWTEKLKRRTKAKLPPMLLTKEPYPELGHTSLGSSFPLYILECALENLVPSSGVGFFFFFTGCPVHACSGQGLPGSGAVGEGPSGSAVADEVMGST